MGERLGGQTLLTEGAGSAGLLEVSKVLPLIMVGKVVRSVFIVRLSVHRRFALCWG